MATVELSTLIGTLKQDHIFHIELNRPQSLNAMSKQFFSDLLIMFQKMEELKTDHDIRVVVLTGRGKHFTAGLDLKESNSFFQHPELDQARQSIHQYNLIKGWQSSVNVLNECSVPTIVGIHGFCIGGGIDLITTSDIRYCTEDAKFSIKEVDLGLAPDLGTLQRLHHVTMNPSLARELAYTGRTFNAAEAKELGLVSKVCTNLVNLHEELFALAKIIASKSPVAIHTTKLIFRQQLKQITDTNLEFMSRVNSSMLFTNDLVEANRANLTKSKAVFPKL